MNPVLLQPQVREYLMEHLHENAAAFILRSHPFGIAPQELVQQLVGLQKARAKFPVLFENGQVLYPPKVNLEQTSSWETAIYKANVVNGNSIIDLTGGFGIDNIAFAKAYPTTIHIELNKDLQELAAHNFKALDLPIQSFQGNGIDFLKSTKDNFDLIYLDPSRKTAAKSKAILLTDYEPNVIEHMDLFFEKSNQILIKTSPMLDITAGLHQLKNVAEIHVVAVKNEVKELLWLLRKNATYTKVFAVNLQSDQPTFKVRLEGSNSINLGEPHSYLYEPNAAIMKTQAFDFVCEQFQVSKLDQDAHLFSRDQLIDFPGRRFKIFAIYDYKPKVIKRELGKSARAIVTRNFRESVKSLRSKYNFTEHETDYLFFTSIAGRGAVVIEAQKL